MTMRPLGGVACRRESDGLKLLQCRSAWPFFYPHRHWASAPALLLRLGSSESGRRETSAPLPELLAV